MREIKFRIWSHENKAMSNWENLTTTEDNKGDLAALLTDPEGFKVEWMQFTGLKDKNGKEIYEGDVVIASSIVKSIQEKHWKKYAKEVKFLLLGANFSISQARGNSHVVIGNIYENPELIK